MGIDEARASEHDNVSRFVVLNDADAIQVGGHIPAGEQETASTGIVGAKVSRRSDWRSAKRPIED